MSGSRSFGALLGLSFTTALVGALTLGLGAAHAAQTVHVELLDKGDGSMAIDLDTAHVKPGKVMFEVTNRSDGVEHEFLIARTELSPDDVPYNLDRAVVDEGALENTQELGDLEPGEAGTLTLDLVAGNYLLFCNEPGHFKAGMYREITVEP